MRSDSTTKQSHWLNLIKRHSYALICSFALFLSFRSKAIRFGFDSSFEFPLLEIKTRLFFRCCYFFPHLVSFSERTRLKASAKNGTRWMVIHDTKKRRSSSELYRKNLNSAYPFAYLSRCNNNNWKLSINALVYARTRTQTHHRKKKLIIIKIYDAKHIISSITQTGWITPPEIVEKLNYVICWLCFAPTSSRSPCSRCHYVV